MRKLATLQKMTQNVLVPTEVVMEQELGRNEETGSFSPVLQNVLLNSNSAVEEIKANCAVFLLAVFNLDTIY